MSEHGRVGIGLAVGLYNLLQNLLIPSWAYVPANLLASGMLIATARSRGCTWSDMGLDRIHATEGAKLGAMGAGVAATAASVALLHPSTRRYLLDQRAADQRAGRILYRTLVRFPAGTALFEEVAFRGVLPAIWRRSGSSRTQATVAAAISFGAWHLIPGADALTGNPLGSRLISRRSRLCVVIAGMVATALSSLGLSWMRERSRSLVAPWMTHAALNGSVYLVGVAAWRNEAREGRLSTSLGPQDRVRDD